MAAAYDAGRTIEQLSGQFRVHRNTVMAALDRANVARRPTGPKLNEQAVSAAAELYAEGLSLATIALRFDVDASTIGNSLKRAGVTLRPRRGAERATDPGEK